MICRGPAWHVRTVRRRAAGPLGTHQHLSPPRRRESVFFAIASVVIALWLLLFTWAGWQRRKHGGGGATAAGAWGELFQPSQRHVQQERERQLALRDDTASGAPPNSVDLDSGKAVIRPVRSPASKHDAP
ncbi:DUF6191 domain-containing protein [Streptomyces sp. NPDC058773]|uniref:DUF6191 domain-containing protein n=1 Tax=Streptomyces sp. NPDC058773 TaxID=3346632 RepID=UPI00369D1E17